MPTFRSLDDDGVVVVKRPLQVATGLERRVVWISWEQHRRSRVLAEALGADLVEIVSARRRPWKYVEMIWHTTIALGRKRPSVLCVQCPSVILGALTVLLRIVFRYRLVLDLHNECVEPFNYDGRFYRGLLKWLWRSSDIAVVTNTALARVIDGVAPVVCVLPDRVPSLTVTASASDSVPLVVFICTFAPDEPYRAVIDAARLVPEFAVHVSGNHSRAADLPAELPPNVTLCGFLPEADYEALLGRADVLIDLTDMENCLVCGAYEAVALGKPLVTSDTAALRAYFSRGTVYARHTPEALAGALRQAVANRPGLSTEMHALRDELNGRWDDAFAALTASISRGA